MGSKNGMKCLSLMLMFTEITSESSTLRGGPGKETRREIVITGSIRRGLARRVLDRGEANGLKTCRYI